MYYYVMFVFLVLIALLCSILLMGYTLKHRNADKTYFLFLISIFSMFYTVGYLLEITSTSYDAAFQAARIQYLGLPFLLPTTYLFVRDFFGESKIKGLRLIALYFIPTIATLLMNLYPRITLYYTNAQHITNHFLSNLRVYPGPLYYLYVVYCYIICVIVVVKLVRKLKMSSQRKRRIIYLLIIATTLPSLGGIPYVLSNTEFKLDFTPIENAVSMAILLYGAHFHNLMNVVPLAHRLTINSMEDALIVCDEDFSFIEANQAAINIFPNLAHLEVGDIIDNIHQVIDNELFITDDLTNQRYYKITISSIAHDKVLVGYSIMFHDITEKERQLNVLKEQATIDPLLKIYNRRALFDKAENLFSIINNETVSLLMLDLDSFKQINDTHGHLVGDAVLNHVLTNIKLVLEEDVILGRYGGDEFVVLFNNKSFDDTLLLANQISHQVHHNPFLLPNRKLVVSLCIGVAYAKADAPHSFDQLLQLADGALYKAKEIGPNSISISESN